MYYDPNQENLNNPSFNNQQLNRDSESSDDGEFEAKKLKMPYFKDKEHMEMNMCSCCMYYHPNMGCMYKHTQSMHEKGDPMMGGQYEHDDPPFDGSFFPRPFFHGHFFPHHFHHHVHHHFYHHGY